MDQAASAPLSVDITPRLIPYLDSHLVIYLLEFEEEFYDTKDISRAKLAVYSMTNMVDPAEEEYKALHSTDKAPPEMLAKRERVLQEVKQSTGDNEPLLSLIIDEDTNAKLTAANEFNMESLASKHNVTKEMVEQLPKHAKLIFECGRYKESAKCLSAYRVLSTNEEGRFLALWGQLAASILSAKFSEALNLVTALREAIDARPQVSQVEQLKQRAWLVHWSLFVFFNMQEGGIDKLIDFFFEDKILNTIQTACPHILRYLSFAVIISDRARSLTKDLTRVLTQERENYADALTSLLLDLNVDFDYDAAQEHLEQSKALVAADFFLGVFRDLLLSRLRLLLFESMCRSHSRINMDVVKRRLGFDDPTTADDDIMSLIGQVRSDVKIDSTQNQLIISSQSSSVYRQVIDKTKHLSMRTQQLAQQVERRYAMHGGAQDD